jgi:hypothetical protein
MKIGVAATILLGALILTPVRSHPAPQVNRRYTMSSGVLIEVSGSQQWERDRVFRLAKSLNFTHESMVPWWRIVILSRPDWDDATDKYNHPNTETAFTLIGPNVTYIREDYLTSGGGTDERIRWTLAHEAGHLSCNCISEDRANALARQFTK